MLLVGNRKLSQLLASVSCLPGAKDGLSQLTENRPGLGKGMSEPSEGSIEPDLFAPFRMEGLVATSESDIGPDSYPKRYSSRSIFVGGGSTAPL